MPQGVGVRVPPSALPSLLLPQAINRTVKFKCCLTGSIIFTTQIDNISKIRKLNTTLESTGTLTSTLKLVIEPADYAGKVKDELKKQAKKANLPGFRPGKVPIGVVRRMVGRSVVIETVNEVVNTVLRDYIKEEKLNLVGDPMPTEQKGEEDFDPNAEKTMEFEFELGHAPEFELNLEVADMPDRYEVSVDEEYFEEQLSHYRERFGGVTNPETLEKGDIFYGRLHEVDEEGNAVEEGFEQLVPFNPIRFENDEFFEQFIGAKIEDIFDINLKEINDDTAKLAELLFIEADQLEEVLDKKLKIEIKRMNRLGTADFNEEFFAKMAEEFKWTDVDIEGMDEESFKARMKESLEEPLAENAKWFYRNQLRDQIIAGHPLEFPDEFLKRWLLRTNENLTQANIDQEYPDYIRSLTWSLIVDKMVEANPEMEIKEEDINEELLRSLRSQFLRMGMPMPPEREQEFLQMAAQNQEMVNNAVQSVVATKVFDLLDEKIIPNQKSISSSEFQKMLEEEEAKRAAEQAAKSQSTDVLEGDVEMEEVTAEDSE